jgi:hypothetical protein
MQDQGMQGFPPMMQMITGYWVSIGIYIVAKLNIADLLQAEQPVPVSQLAKQAQVNEAYLYRVMRALAGVGIFKESDGQRFEQTPLSQLLRSDVRGSMHGIAVMMC